MARRTRKILSLDVDSALVLMQEIYNDIGENKNTASIIMKKMLSFMKESEDMTLIGPVIKEQQKILNACTEKKISLVKLQSTLLKQMSAGNNTSGGMGGGITLSEEDRDLIEKMMSNDELNDNEEYDV